MAQKSTSQSLQPGVRLQSKERVYEIVKVLGSGSFGITYLATGKVSIGNITTTLRFAIKEHFISASCYRDKDGATMLTVPTAETDVRDSRADFLTEANRLKKMCLKSRSIVSVNETFEANGTAYYVMEFLDGGIPSKCSEEEAVDIVMQVADALQEIHDENVLHLDLKPDNIVMKTNEKGETYPVLIDFGISKHFDSKGRPTSSLNAKGASPGYAPQEQYAGVSEFSPKFDIYALGAVLYFLTTGKNPPDAFKISPNQQELKKELQGKVSTNVEKAILNAMKPNAAERTPTIKQFCDDLKGIDFVPFITLDNSKLDFTKDKGSRNITVYSNIGWTVYSDANWCRVIKKGNIAEVSVAKNKEPGNRHCNIFINGAPFDILYKLPVTQKGVGTIPFSSRPSWWARNSKIIYAACGCVLAGGLITLLCLLFKPDPLKESQKLTEAIAANDESTLKKFVDRDSVRAFSPYANILLSQSRFDEARDLATKMLATSDSVNGKSVLDIIAGYEALANKVAAENAEAGAMESPTESPVAVETPAVNQPEGQETNDEKFARAKNDFNLMLSLANDNYSKAYYPLAQMYFGKGDKTNAKKWAQKAVNANVNKSSAQSLLTKINQADTQTAELSLDEQFKQAKSIDDYRKLAEKGYQKAYAPLAEMYLKKYDYDNAHRWATKAGRAKVDVSRARNVINTLDKMDYYINGENGGKPNF